MAMTAAALEHSRDDAGAAAPLAGRNVLFVLGAPRSGTTWLAKIFDSHPDVLYRHEPDTVLREERLPVLCRPEEVARYRDTARAYLDRLLDIRTLKSAGSLPVFAKRYHGPLAQQVRAGIVFGLRLAEQAPGLGKWAKRVAIPDLLDRSGGGPAPLIVVKSVSSRGRARLFVEALPGCRIVFIVRHPCGQVASMVRGVKLGKFEKRVPLDEILATEQAVRHGLTRERFDALSPVEQYAWHWAVLNQKALDDLAGVPGVKIVRYEDLGAEPVRTAQELFGFAGLSWDPQTASFMEKSTTYSGPDRYFQVTKNSIAAMNKWRTELSPDDQRQILEIAKQTAVGRLFP